MGLADDNSGKSLLSGLCFYQSLLRGFAWAPSGFSRPRNQAWPCELRPSSAFILGFHPCPAPSRPNEAHPLAGATSGSTPFHRLANQTPVGCWTKPAQRHEDQEKRRRHQDASEGEQHAGTESWL